MAGGEDFVDRATRASDPGGSDAAEAVASAGSSAARLGEDSRVPARKREGEGAGAAAAVASGMSSEENTTETGGAEPRTHASKLQDKVATSVALASSGSSEMAISSRTADPQAIASGGEAWTSTKRRRQWEVVVDDSRPSSKRRLRERVAVAAVGWNARASGKSNQHEEVTASETQESQRTATFEYSRPSFTRRLRVGAAAQEDEPFSELVRAQDVLSLPENVIAQIMRSLPRQMAAWQLNHQPASFRFQLRDGIYPSPDELASLLTLPKLLRIKRFSLVVHTDEVSDRQMAGYLTRASQCCTEELTLEYHDSVNNTYQFHLAGCATSLMRLILRNITVYHESLAVTPVFPMLSVMSLSSVRISSGSLTQVVALCPSLNTLTLTHISLLFEIVFEPPVTMLRSVTITECYNITLLDLESLSGLQTFFYVGPMVKMYFNKGACVQNMLLCSGGNDNHADPAYEWMELAPNFSMLSVLTFSSSCLYGLNSGTSGNLNLNALKELQVLFDPLDSTIAQQLHTFLCDICCTNLEKLFLQLGQNTSDLDMGEENPLADQELDFRNLALIKADEFCGSNTQISLLRTLLKATRVAKLVLCSTSDQGDLKQKLASLEECSETTEVILLADDRIWPQPTHVRPTRSSSRTAGLRPNTEQMILQSGAGTVKRNLLENAARAT